MLMGWYQLVTNVAWNGQAQALESDAMGHSPHSVTHTTGWYWQVTWHPWTFSSVQLSRSVISDSLQPHGLYSPWNFPGQNTEVGSRPLLQGIFSTQGSNPGFPHCKQILYQLSHKGRILDVKIGPRHTTLYTDKNFHLKTSHQNTAQ